MVLTTSSCGILFLKSLVTGHSSLGSLRKLGPISQEVFLPTSKAVQVVLVGRSARFRGPAICCRGSKSVSGNFAFHSLNLPMTTALLLAKYGFNKPFSDSTAEIVHSESRQQVTEVRGSLMLTKAKSRSFVARTRPFISVQGTVMPLSGATLAFDRRRRASGISCSQDQKNRDHLHPEKLQRSCRLQLRRLHYCRLRRLQVWAFPAHVVVVHFG